MVASSSGEKNVSVRERHSVDEGNAVVNTAADLKDKVPSSEGINTGDDKENFKSGKRKSTCEDFSISKKAKHDGADVSDTKIADVSKVPATSSTPGKDDKTDLAKEREAVREAQREAKRLQKEREEEKKREAKRLKKEEDEERRRLKKEKEEEERRLKREAIEAEKEAKRLQKEHEKAEKARKREVELKAREERKRADEEEKRKKKEEIERKKQEKLLEKQRIEEEKERKRAEEENKKQKRSIMNFFKPKSTTSTAEGDDANTSVTEDGNVSIDLTGTPQASRSTNEETYVTFSSPVAEPKIAPTNDFESYFLPFYVKPNMQIANNQLPESNKWDAFIEGKYNMSDSDGNIDEDVEMSANVERAIDVLKCLNAGSVEEANRLFRNVPLKYLKFYENRRAAYFGTFSYSKKDVIEDVNIRLNPCTKVTLTRCFEDPENKLVIDYDYDSDSDAGGEDDDEEGEGEDLNSGDEEDEEDEEEAAGTSDIDEFVETDGIPNSEGKRKGAAGPLVAVVRHCMDTQNSGDGGDEFGRYFSSLQWERLDHTIQFPIDPFPKDEPMTHTKKQNLLPTDSATSIEASVRGTSTATTPAATVLVPKRKTVTDPQALVALQAFVASQGSLTVGTLAELAVKGGVPALDGVTVNVVKNTLRAHAKFDRKESKWIWHGVTESTAPVLSTTTAASPAESSIRTSIITAPASTPPVDNTTAPSSSSASAPTPVSASTPLNFIAYQPAPTTPQ